MKICKAMVDQSNAIYMLEGHEHSVGATDEFEFAREHNKKILFDKNALVKILE